jgi:hypothetical protein
MTVADNQPEKERLYSAVIEYTYPVESNPPYWTTSFLMSRFIVATFESDQEADKLAELLNKDPQRAPEVSYKSQLVPGDFVDKLELFASCKLSDRDKYLAEIASHEARMLAQRTVTVKLGAATKAIRGVTLDFLTQIVDEEGGKLTWDEVYSGPSKYDGEWWATGRLLAPELGQLITESGAAREYLKQFRLIENVAQTETNPIQLAILIGQLESYRDMYGSGDEEVKLKASVQGLRSRLSAAPSVAEAAPQVNEPTPAPHILYRQEFIRCGKATCKKCVAGPSHGPYWYSFQTVNGKVRKKYLGKNAPYNATSSVTKATKATKVQCWLIDEQADEQGFSNQIEAEKWQAKLNLKSKIYQAATKAEAWEQHKKFLVAWSNGRTTW